MSTRNLIQVLQKINKFSYPPVIFLASVLHFYVFVYYLFMCMCECMSCLLFFSSSTQATVMWKEDPQHGKCLYKITYRQVCRTFY